jgi:hypothetical protein
MSRRRGAVALVLFVAIGALFGVVFARLNRPTLNESMSQPPSGESATPRVHGNLVQNPGPAPFRSAEAYDSISAAERAVPGLEASTPRPNMWLASDQSIALVWATPEGDRLEIQYDSGLRLQVTPAQPRLWDPAEAAKEYKVEAEESADSTQGKAAMITIDGVPAFVIPDGAAVFANGESQGTPGLLESVVANRQIDIVGHFATSDLVEVLRSMLASSA